MELRYNQNSSNILHITKGIKPEAEKHDIRLTKAMLARFNHVYLLSSKALLRESRYLFLAIPMKTSFAGRTSALMHHL